MHESVRVKEGKLTQATVDLFYLDSVLVCCLLLNPKLGCVIWQGEFPCACSKLAILLPSLVPSKGLLLQEPVSFPGASLLDQSMHQLWTADLYHMRLFSAGVPGLPCLMLSQTHTNALLWWARSHSLRDRMSFVLLHGQMASMSPPTPANRTIWEHKGQLGASLLPRMVPRSHISAGWFYIRSRNSPLTPYANPLQVTPPRPHSRTTAETQSGCVSVCVKDFS